MNTKVIARHVLGIAILVLSIFLASQAGAQCDLCPSTSIVWERHIVGDLNADIFIAAPDGSRLVNLTNHPSGDWSPALSPDGRRVAFVSNRSGSNGLYVMDADGQNLMLVPTSVAVDWDRPSWSPDGTMLAFTGGSVFNTSICIARLDGTGLLCFATDEPRESGAAWSPDGVHIAFNRNDSLYGYNIYTVNVLTLEEKKLTNQRATQPAWAPDGSSIAFVGNWGDDVLDHGIYTMDSDGGNVVAVTSGPASDGYPTWSPDGSQIAFARFNDRNNMVGDIYRVRRDGTGLAIVSNHEASEHTPSWGPIFTPAADIKFASPGVQITLQYRDQSWPMPALPSAAGQYWIEGALFKWNESTPGVTLTADVGRIDDQATLYGLKAGDYFLMLSYGNLPDSTKAPGWLDVKVPVDIEKQNEVVKVTADLSDVTGVIQGAVILNGAAPGAGLSLCLRPHSEISYFPLGFDSSHYWCMDLAPSGNFSVLLPRGPGSGEICSNDLLTGQGGCYQPIKDVNSGPGQPQLYQAFTYDVQPHTTTDVTPSINP